MLAVFLDPNNNGLDVIDVAYGLAALLSAFTIAAGAIAAWRKACKRLNAAFTVLINNTVEPLIDAKLAHYTYPIQPTANGGKSLPDLNRKVDALMSHLGIKDDSTD